jgi:hypothetical protein
MLEELEQLAAENKEDKQLQDLVAELKEAVEELKEPGVDQREVLAKLSDMQTAVAAAQVAYNVEAVDAQLQELGSALAPAAALKNAAQALAKGEYNKAAEQLEQLEPENISRKEAKTLAENLKKLAKKSGEGHQGQLSRSTAELSEGLENENKSQCKGGACKLAGLCRSQSVRKGIGTCLGCQLGRLSECKSNCSKNGGNCVAKSNQPKSTWGTGASGQPLGDEQTSLSANRNREEITGTAGAGPSEKEISHSPEGREEARRNYNQQYQKYKRMTEAVLDSEPLPLGHRQTIRQYFESIRPENGDSTDEVAPEAPAAAVPAAG